MAPLVAGLISLVVLVGVYFAVTSYNARKQAEADAESNAANAKIMLAEYKSADVRNIEYSYNGEVVRLENKNDYWYDADDNMFPLDQKQPMTMAGALASIAADRLVEDSNANMASYGLDNPQEYIEVKYGDGTGLKMLFGDLNSFTGTQYMNIGGTGKVYLVATALLDFFKYTRNDLIMHDILPAVDIKSLTELAITERGADGEKLIRYTREKPAETSSDTSSEGTESVWMLDDGSGESVKVKESVVSGLLGGVTSLALKNCAAYNVRDDETLRGYGLGSGAAKTITVKYTETAGVAGESSPIASGAARTVDKQFTVDYSPSDNEGGYYVNLVGSKLVYKLAI